MTKNYLVFILFTCLCACRHTEGNKIILRVGHTANEEHTWHKALRYFSELLRKESKGRIELQVYPSEQLGKEIEMIRSIQAGIVDMTVTGGTLQNWTEYAAFSDMPYLLRDSRHLRKLAEGKIGKMLQKKILEETGIRVIAFFEMGSRHLTSKRPIKSPDELKGILLRVPNVPSYVRVWQALGAKPTPMALSEVFTSLQQGVIEAQENPFAMIYSSGFFEVQKYLNLTAHVNSWGNVIMGEKQFQKIPKDLQAVFLKAAQKMQTYEHKLFLEKENWLISQLKEKGLEFIQVNQQAFREKAGASMTEGLSAEGLKIFRAIQQIP